eukprot:TRINITY_DN3623_c0_g1_i1.p2 TRINITY_DN3623_c0_g1~~TRINITY_DN3623_c0_g1_i1.p2  ORF type:complete len:107 (+),score=21.27 TRINITY_DN3623_c0_g1_i1:156-476(+)
MCIRDRYLFIALILTHLFTVGHFYKSLTECLYDDDVVEVQSKFATLLSKYDVHEQLKEDQTKNEKFDEKATEFIKFIGNENQESSANTNIPNVQISIVNFIIEKYR